MSSEDAAKDIARTLFGPPEDTADAVERVREQAREERQETADLLSNQPGEPESEQPEAENAFIAKLFGPKPGSREALERIHGIAREPSIPYEPEPPEHIKALAARLNLREALGGAEIADNEEDDE